MIYTVYFLQIKKRKILWPNQTRRLLLYEKGLVTALLVFLNYLVYNSNKACSFIAKQYVRKYIDI